MRLDVNSFVGAYPFRRVPGTSVEAVLQSMERIGVDQAWISHLPSVFWRDPAEGNPWLYQITDSSEQLRPVPAIHPGLKGWEQGIREARSRGAPAVRCDPNYYGLEPTGLDMRSLVQACAGENMALIMAVRLEDARQRHPNDRAPELTAAAVRTLLRADPALRLLITHADRSFVEEVHFGSTPEESARIWWDICWIWGPPEDHLETLLGTVGVDRFVFGTGQPLRMPENSVAKLDLLNLSSEHRSAIEAENALALCRSSLKSKTRRVKA